MKQQISENNIFCFAFAKSFRGNNSPLCEIMMFIYQTALFFSNYSKIQKIRPSFRENEKMVVLGCFRQRASLNLFDKCLFQSQKCCSLELEIKKLSPVITFRKHCGLKFSNLGFVVLAVLPYYCEN